MTSKRRAGNTTQAHRVQKPVRSHAAVKRPRKTVAVKRLSLSQKRLPSKKAKKANRRKLPEVKNVSKARTAIYQPEPPESYDYAIIRNMLLHNESAEAHVSAEAIIFSKLMIYLSMPVGEQYRSGFRLGKLYYGQAISKTPKWYEDSIPELAKFFQRLGYAAKYQISRSGNPAITLKPKSNIKLGFNVHSFEAGIISGFLSHAKNAYVAMHESECTCNGAEECVFEHGQINEIAIDKKALMKNYARHLAASHIKRPDNGNFSRLYNAMILSEAKHVRGSIPEMRSLGEYVNKEFGFDGPDSKSPVRMISEIMRSVSASSNSEYSASGIKFTFDPMNSDSRYMDSLRQFTSGLTNDKAKTSISLSDTGLSYVLAISFDAKLLKLKNK